jgi:glycosyltransferase involved in cell wall biosynthesis
MKKILFVIENLGSGGAQKQLYLICSGLIDVYDQITVYCYADYGKDFYTERLQSMGIRIVKQSNQGYIKRILTLRAFIKADTPTTLISFLYGANMLSTLVKSTLNREFRLIVSDRTGVVGKMKIKDMLRYQLYRNADVVVANSSHTANVIVQRAPWLSKKTRVIWNIVDSINGQKSLNNDKLIFLIGARYHKIKNHEKFLLAFIQALKKAQHPELIYLKCFGNKMEESNIVYIERLEKIIKDSGFSQNIELNGETLEMKKELIESDICVLPSLYEGCPNFIIEAMSAGKVILLSDVCSNSDIVNEEGGFLFNPESISEMTDKILLSINLTKEARMQMGIINKKKIDVMFNPKDRLQEFMDLIW